MIYHFGQHIRWSGPWESPNILGAFLAMILPLSWFGWRWFQPRGFAAVAGGMAEVFLYFALCKTYSRGAVVAFVVAALFFGAWFFSRRMQPAFAWKRLVRGCAWRAFFFFGAMVATSFNGRMRPDYVATDRSVQNRLGIWTGAIHMIHGNEIRGWGWNNGTASYEHWFQADDDNQRFGNLVSGNLQFVVETGLIATFAAGTILALCFGAALVASENKALSHPLEPAPTRNERAALGACVLAAFLVGNTFSVIASFPMLSGGAALAAAFCLWHWWTLQAAEKWRVTRWALAVAATGVAFIWLASVFVSHAERISIRRLTGNVIEIRGRASDGPLPVIDIYPDPEVLNPRMGNSLRRLGIAVADRVSLRVHPDDDDPGPECDRLMLLGRRAEIGRRFPAKRKALIHPLFAREYYALSRVDLLVLPEFDQAIENEAWRRACGTATTVRFSPGRGVCLEGLETTELADIVTTSMR